MTAQEWNESRPVGTPVRYYPTLPPRNEKPPVDTRTRSKAWTLGSGHVVVAIEGRAGGVSVEHLEVLS